MFCQYKDILGKVGEGPHSLRIFDIAIVDVILTIIGAYLINLLVFPNCKYLIGFTSFIFTRDNFT